MKFLSEIGWWVTSKLAFKIHDAFTGEFLGRGWVITFGRGVYVIGYRGDKPLVPVFLPQKRLRYWRLELGFTTKEQPDFKNVRKSD